MILRNNNLLKLKGRSTKNNYLLMGVSMTFLSLAVRLLLSFGIGICIDGSDKLILLSVLVSLRLNYWYR